MLMLSFILLFNAWFILAQKIPEMKEGLAGKRIFRLVIQGKGRESSN